MSSRALEVHFELMRRLGVRTVRGIKRSDPDGQRQWNVRDLNKRILDLRSLGRGFFEIAKELNVSISTVRRHLGGDVKALK